MDYLAVEWIHSDPDDPVLLYSEIDKEGWETRKVEIYRNGSLLFADESHETDEIGLSTEQMPSIEEIASDPEFKPRKISSEEFELIWHQATQS